MFKSLYKENLDGEKLNASVELMETVLNLSKGNEEDVRSSEVRVQEAKKSSKGLNRRSRISIMSLARL